MLEELEKYKSLGFFARQMMEGFITGMHKSPFHGFSVEFSEHRLYNSGESTKNIDWKLFGRTDKLFVKRFEEETNLRCQIVIDHSGSMLFPLKGQGDLRHPNKLTFSIYAAALLTELMVRQRDAYGLSLVSSKIDLQTEVRSSKVHQHHILEILEGELARRHDANATVTDRTHVAEALHLIAERQRRRSLIVIFTDGFYDEQEQDALMDALRHLRHCNHEVILFHTQDHSQEVDFAFDNKPTEFVDLEDGRSIKLNPAEVAASYREQVVRLNARMKQSAIQYRVDYVPIDVSKGFEEVVMPYLLKRNKR